MSSAIALSSAAAPTATAPRVSCSGPAATSSSPLAASESDAASRRSGYITLQTRSGLIGLSEFRPTNLSWSASRAHCPPAPVHHHRGGTSQKRPNRHRSSSHRLIRWSSPATHQTAGHAIAAGPVLVVEEEGAGHDRVGEEQLHPRTSCGLIVTSRPSALRAHACGVELRDRAGNRPRALLVPSLVWISRLCSTKSTLAAKVRVS
jgi:hypothetical protein